MPYSLRRGLITPTVSIVDANGCIIESEQRKIFRHVVQNGFGTDVIFANGTTGEWNQINNQERLRLIEIAVDETNRINADLQKSSRPKNIEVWLGLNGSTKQEIITNLNAAIRFGAHAVVIAPLAIDDLPEDDIVRFFRRDLNGIIEAAPREMPVFLYDNADINSPGRTPHIRTHIVKDLSRLPWVYGLKVSASRRVLGNYTKAALHFKQPHEFGIYIGNANLIFDWYRPKKGFVQRLQSGWKNWLLHDHLPIGVISGPANVLPREWQKAWNVCWAGDEELMNQSQQMAEKFEALSLFNDANSNQYTGKMIACLKYALELDGVISSSFVAGKTKALTEEDRKIFSEKYFKFKNKLRQKILY
jgi:dihydrodipicolinate synthase/N-acetylneuraminate lyase